MKRQADETTNLTVYHMSIIYSQYRHISVKTEKKLKGLLYLGYRIWEAVRGRSQTLSNNTLTLIG